MSEIFNTNDLLEINELNTELPLYKSFKIDLENSSLDQIQLLNEYATPHESLLLWCYFALKHRKDTWDLYSSNFGATISDVLGKDINKSILESELKSSISNALLVNEYILNIDFKSFKWYSDSVEIEIEITTIYNVSDFTVKF